MRNNFLHACPLASFFLLALALGAAIIYLVGSAVLPPELALSAALSASTAGIIMTAVLDGRAGLKRLLSRLLIWRVGIGYWLFALLFIVPVFLTGSLLNPLFSADPLSLSNLKPAFNILPVFLAFLVVAGLGQELGWTGFLMPRLQARFNALAASLIRAVLVVLWHLPLLIYAGLHPHAIPDFPYGFWIAQRGFLVAFSTMLVMFSLPWSIFLTWMYNNTAGSLLLVSLLHGSEIWVAYWMLSAGIRPASLDNYWGYGLVLFLSATLIVMFSGPAHLSSKHRRVVHQPFPGQETL